MKKQGKSKWYFLIIILIIYLILLLTNYSAFITSIQFFMNLIKKVILSLIIVFFLIFVVDYFVNQKSIIKHFNEKSKIKWLYALIGATIASGPPYLWYPLLKNLNEKGISKGIIACFLYSRSIKIPYLPLLIFYFGFKYTIILSITMMVMGVIQGLIIDKIIKPRRPI